MQEKILITGHTGMLGLALVKKLYSSYQLFGVALDDFKVKHIQAVKLDLCQQEAVFQLVKKIKPNLVIHTAAATSVDGCEEDPEMAQRVNVDATSNIAQAAKEAGAFFIYISTDFVFDGRKGNYTEEDQPNPQGVYAQTKLAGEKAVQNIYGVQDKNYLILRVTIYGWNLLNQNKKSLPEMVIENLSQGKKFTPFNDQFFTPIYVGTLAKIIEKLYNQKNYGFFNIACDERLSKYDFACQTAKIWGLDQNLIQPISVNSVNYKAPRPIDASLNNKKIKKVLGLKNVFLEDDLKAMKQDYRRLKKLIL